MTSKKAIQILEKQIQKSTDTKDIWIIQTASYIKQFFGEDSHQYGFIKNLQEYEGDSFSSYADEFLESCIETIEDIGLYKKRRKRIVLNKEWADKNWLLSKIIENSLPISITAIVSILVTAITINLTCSRSPNQLQQPQESKKVYEQTKDTLK